MYGYILSNRKLRTQSPYAYLPKVEKHEAAVVF